MSGSQVDISGVPALFYRFSSGAVRTFLGREAIDQYQLDEASIRSQMRIEPEGDRDRIVSSWLKLKAEEGAYALDRRALSRGLEGQDLTLFVADFAWPKRVPAAVYQITVYECRDGTVTRQAAQSFPVIRVGLPAWLSSLANDRAVWYGVGAALVAGLLGLGTDRLMAWLFRTRRA